MESFVAVRKAQLGLSASRQALISGVTAGLLLAFGIGTAIATIWLVIRSYSPAIYWDQWQIVDLLMRVHGHPTLRQLWSQHNEHRILVGRLFCFADFIFFHGRSISLLVEMLFVQLLQVMLFIFMLRRYSHIAKSAFISLTGLLLYCFFSFLQMENFSWGFQIVFVFAALASSATFAFAVCRSDLPGSSIRSNLLLAGALLAAFLAEASLANGLLVWPFLFLLAICLRFSRLEISIIALTGAAAIAAYLIGYQSPGYLSDPFVSIRHPLAVLKYVVTYLAFSWDPNVPNASAWPVFSESITFLAMAFVVFEAIRWFKSPQRNRLEAFLLVNMLFALATASVTALGRINLGYAQATGGRYQTYALMFWACFAILIALKLVSLGPNRAFLVTGAQVIALLLLLSVASRFNGIEAQAFERQARWNKGMAALQAHAYKSPDLALIYHTPQILPVYYSFLVQHGWTSKEHLPMNPVSVSASREAPRISGYQLSSGSRCAGYLDAAIQLPGKQAFAVSGWAWDKGSQRPPARIVLATSKGLVVASGVTGSPRPDVSKSFPPAHDANPGWTATMQSPGNGNYEAFAILGDGKSACPLQNSLTIHY